MAEHDIVIGILMEEECLGLEELAAACGVEPEWVLRYMNEGLLDEKSGPADQWRFTSSVLRRARRIRSIEHAYEAAPELAALVADLLEEMDELKARLLRGEFG